MADNHDFDRFIRTYTQRIEKDTVLGLNGQCLIWTGTSKSNAKYGVLNIDLKDFPVGVGRTTIHVHRLAFTLQHRLQNFPVGDVSHLCHNSKCVNVDHLVNEDHITNNSRRSCVSCGRCLGHPAPSPPCRLDLKMPNNDIGNFLNNAFEEKTRHCGDRAVCSACFVVSMTFQSISFLFLFYLNFIFVSFYFQISK